VAKLRIDLQSGILEVEGEESLVKQVYDDFKERITELIQLKQLQEPGTTGLQGTPVSTSLPKSKKVRQEKSAGKRKESYSIVKDLDFAPKNGVPSLKDFFASKSPSAAREINAVIVYYLQKVAGIQGISVDHVYTCYKHLGERVPGAFRQSLFDTASKKGWIDTKSLDNITVTTLGENLVEHELPKTSKT